MTEKQGGSDVRANTTRAPRAATTAEYELTGHKWFCSAPMCDLFLVLAQTDEGVTCFALPRVLPDGTRNAGFQLQRLKDKLGNRSNASQRGRVPRRLARAWSASPGRGVPTIIEMVNHTRLDCVIGTAARDARRGRAGDVARRAPQRVRQAPGRPAADGQRARRPRDRVRGGDRARAAPRARLRRGADDPSADAFKRLATAVGQVPRLQARPRPRLRGAGVPGRQRLRRGVGDAAPVPRGAAGLDLGGLGQRHGPRRPARAGPQPRGARRLLRRGRRRPPAPTRGSTRFAAATRAEFADLEATRAARPARGRAHGAVRCRARCSCATPRPRWPTPSAPRAWPATRGCTTARCPPGVDAAAIVARHTPPV